MEENKLKVYGTFKETGEPESGPQREEEGEIVMACWLR